MAFLGRPDPVALTKIYTLIYCFVKYYRATTVRPLLIELFEPGPHKTPAVTMLFSVLRSRTVYTAAAANRYL